MKTFYILIIFSVILEFTATSQYINQDDRKVYTDTNYTNLFTGELITNYDNEHVKYKWKYN